MDRNCDSGAGTPSARLHVQARVRLRCALLSLFAAILLILPARSQSTVMTGSEIPSGDRSFYLDQPIDHPEALSGIWETPDGNGGAFGIHLQLMTTVPADADPPLWTPQSWQPLEVDVFQRKGSEIASGDENSFADSVRGGSVRLSGGRLALHFPSSATGLMSIDLDLLHQSDDCWHGRFHRGNVDSVVTLCRPTPGPSIASNALVGTWSTNRGCIHTFQTGPGTFTGWSDTLQIPVRWFLGVTIQDHTGSFRATAT